LTPTPVTKSDAAAGTNSAGTTGSGTKAATGTGGAAAASGSIPKNTSGLRPLLPNKDPSSYTLSDVLEVMDNALVYISDIGAVLAVFLLIWTAFGMVNNFGNVERIEASKKSIFWILLGVAVLMMARVFVDLIFNFMTKGN
jgi:hypothetical protein